MQELKPIEKTYYIAYENEIIHYGIIEANQSFATALTNFDTFTDINNWVDKLSALGINDVKLSGIDNAKRDKISEIKKECERLIEKDNWRIERYDFQKRIGVETSETETVINNLLTQFENYRKQSNTMETEVNALTTEEEVRNYKVNFS